jgi:hypothetical protein
MVAEQPVVGLQYSPLEHGVLDTKPVPLELQRLQAP